MGNDKQPTPLVDATNALRDAVRAVPSLVVVVGLWFVVLRYGFARFAPFTAISDYERQAIAWILSVPIGLITYYLGNVWDDRIFDPLYSEDPRRGFSGKWLNRSQRAWFGLFPSGTELAKTRSNAAIALGLSNTEGVYAAAKEKLQSTDRWTAVGQLLFLSKLTRSLIWPSLLIAAGMWAGIAQAWVRRRVQPLTVIEAATLTIFGLLLFSPYLTLRVEHMLLLYRRVAREPKPRKGS